MDNMDNRNPFESGSGNWESVSTPASEQQKPAQEQVTPTVTEQADNGKPATVNPYVAQYFSEHNQSQSKNETTTNGSTNPYVADYFNNQTNSNTQAPKDSKNKSSGLSIASMVLGIVSSAMTVGCCCCSALVGGIICLVTGALGVILGIISLVKFGKDGKAIAGIITGGIGALLGIVGIVIEVFFLDYIISYLDEYYPEWDFYDSGSDYNNFIINSIKNFFKR